MIIPGTTISVTLMPTYVEVRDKGIVKKKILLKAKSYDDISLELQKYFRYLGKRLAPGVLEEVLDRIGLPRAKRVIAEPEPEPVVEEPIAKDDFEPEIISEPPQEIETPPKKKGKKKKEVKKEKAAATFVQSAGMSADEKGVISADDFDDIAGALEAVEALSDSFMAGVKEPSADEKKEEIRISLEGRDEIVASGSTYSRAPRMTEELIEESLTEDEKEMVELVAETIDEELPSEEEKGKVTQVTPTHQIKPIIECKALLLGETGVGKRSLKSKAGIMPLVIDEKTNEVSQYIYNKMFDGAHHRINLNVWSFDLAVKAKLPRKDFYKEAQMIIIAYAASDRWSFESIDFWLREASISCDHNLPIVIVANKVDLRSNIEDDTGEEPVSFEEGFQFAEELAKKLSTGKDLHPVAFIETSCLTGENTESVFKTAANLFENYIQTKTQ
ncbi:MAG: Rab family GTPase [Candidatus Odinarchaeota archaeon]